MTRGAKAILGFPVRVVLRGLALPVRPVAARVDASARLGRLLVKVSSAMAARRGLLLLIGTGLVGLSLLAHGITIGALVLSDAVDSALAWLCLPLALLHLGLLLGFTGILLAVPLGPGYPARRE